MSAKPPPTIDDMSIILPSLVRALGLVVEQMESLTDLACQATTMSEETADAMNDVGYALIEQSRTLMHEAQERRRTGRGWSILSQPDERDTIDQARGPELMRFPLD